MNQQCKVCGEPAAGFHFGAFTCEGCKSFFGRTYNNLSSISECKNNGECIINKKNRTACKACRLRKCLLVGMSKSGSRYGRRSNWFKIHCLLQEQQQQQQIQIQSSKSPPIFSPSQINSGAFLPANILPAAALAGYYKNSPDKMPFTDDIRRHSASPSDSGASSADPEDDSSRSTSALSFFKPGSSPTSDKDVQLMLANKNSKDTRKRKLSSNIALALPPSPFGSGSSATSYSPHSVTYFNHTTLPNLRTVPPGLLTESWPTRAGGDLLLCSPQVAGIAIDQEQPIDLSIKSTALMCRTTSKNDCTDSEPELSIDIKDDDESKDAIKTPLDLSLVSNRSKEVAVSGQVI